MRKNPSVIYVFLFAFLSVFLFSCSIQIVDRSSLKSTCRRCGAQLAEPKLGHKIECPSCHAVYSAKTRTQALFGAPHCALCGSRLLAPSSRAIVSSRGISPNIITSATEGPSVKTSVI